jgi:hypothetical protein
MDYLNDILISPVIEIINEYNKTSIEDMKTITNYKIIQPYYYGSFEVFRYMNLETNNEIFYDTCMFDLLDAKIEKCWYFKNFINNEYQCVFHNAIYKNCDGYYVYVSGYSSKNYKHWQQFDVKYSKNQFHFWDEIIPKKIKNYINSSVYNEILHHIHFMSFGKYYEINLYENSIMNIYAILRLSKEKEIIKTVFLNNKEFNNLRNLTNNIKNSETYLQCITTINNESIYNKIKLDNHIYNLITRYL